MKKFVKSNLKSQSMEMKLEPCPGVTLNVLQRQYNGVCIINDIFVEDGIKEVCIKEYCSLYIKGCGVFPDVETLKIGKNVIRLEIDNQMFPNLLKIECEPGALYKSRGTLLIRNGAVVNAFNIHNDKIDMSNIMTIERNAFSGCTNINLINTENVIKVAADAFDDNVLPTATPENPLCIIGDSIITDVYEPAHIDIPEDLTISCIVNEKDNVSVTSLTIHNLKQLNVVLKTLHPQTLTIDSAEIISPVDLEELKASVSLSYIDITEKNPYYKSINGILYNKDHSVLLLCPKGMTGTIQIPNGVKHIESNAFAFSRISEVIISDSVVNINSSAFFKCIKLTKVQFGNSLEVITESMFYGCSSLTEIEIPGTVKFIEEDAFNYTPLKKLILNEGTLRIKNEAFARNQLEEVKIPDSLMFLGLYNFANVNKIYFEHLSSPEILMALINHMHDVNEPNIIEIFLGKNKYIIANNVIDNRNFNEFANHMYYHPDDIEYAYSLYERQRASLLMYKYAIVLYKERPTDKLKAYLKKASRVIVTYFLDDSQYESLIEFIQFGVCTRKTLEKLYETSLQYKLPEISAYILAEIEKLPKKNLLNGL